MTKTILDWPVSSERVCNSCGGTIPAGTRCVRLTQSDGVSVFLHKDCATKFANELLEASKKLEEKE